MRTYDGYQSGFWSTEQGKQYVRHTYRHVPHPIYPAVAFQPATADDEAQDCSLNTVVQVWLDKGQKYFAYMNYIAQQLVLYQDPYAQIGRAFSAAGQLVSQKHRYYQ